MAGNVHLQRESKDSPSSAGVAIAEALRKGKDSDRRCWNCGMFVQISKDGRQKNLNKFDGEDSSAQVHIDAVTTSELIGSIFLTALDDDRAETAEVSDIAAVSGEGSLLDREGYMMRESGFLGRCRDC